jgi:hypothetical protein
MGKMENVITYESNPDLSNVIFIEGLPGVGNVGKIAADFLCYQYKAKRLATIFSSELPPQVFVDKEGYFNAVCTELWYMKDIAGHDLIFLVGDFQASTPQGQFELCKYIFEKILKYDPQLVITLGGYGLGEVVKEPQVLAVTNNTILKTQLEKDGAVFRPNEPQGGIVGAAAMFILLANEYDIDAICLMGETSGFLLDHKSAKCVVEVLCRTLGIENVDTSDMDASIQQVEQINEEVQALAETNPEDLSYFR